MGRTLGYAAQQIVQPGLIGLGEIMQHIIGHRILVAGMADAQPHPAVGIAQMRMDRTQAVVPGMAAAILHPAFAGGKVQLVMQHHDVGQIQFVKPQGCGHRLPRKVHEGFGLEQQHLLPAQPPLGDLALKGARPAAKAMIGGDPVHRHAADVVAVARIFRARIAKPHPKFHRRTLRFPVPQIAHAGAFEASLLDLAAPFAQLVMQAKGWGHPHEKTRKLRITVVCSMRNEGPFIVEWVTWYRMLGFTDIVVVTNNCTDRSPELLGALEAARWVRHIRCDVEPGQKITARKLAVAKESRSVRKAGWVFVCDVDEFLVIHKGAGLIGDLIDLASPEPGFLGMSINWKVFGTGGRKRFEDQPVHQQFLQACAGEHGSSHTVKSIFRQPEWFKALGEHGPRGLNLGGTGQNWGEAPGLVWVNSEGRPVEKWQPRGPYLRSLPAAGVSHKVAQINHYMLRSDETFSLKRRTLSPVGLHDRYTRYYYNRANNNKEMDPSAFRYATGFAALHAKAMALPDVYRLHQLSCADHIRLICEKAGIAPEADPRHAAFLALAGA